MPATIRLLIVSSASNERARIQAELQACPDLTVVAVCGDIFSALEALSKVKPDVMLLDVDMPGGGSLALVHKIMKSQPTPIIAMFTDGVDGQTVAAQNLAVGVAGVQAKHTGRCNITDMVAELRARILRISQGASLHPVAAPKTAFETRVSSRPSPAFARSRESASDSSRFGAQGKGQIRSTKVIVIGASTGGTQALSRVLEPLPGNLPGIAIVQHMPADFTGRLAERLNRRSEITVLEAEDGMAFLPGHAYIAPGGLQFALKQMGSDYFIALSDGPLVGGHKPAVEHLFNSVALAPDIGVMAIMLTGMGSDGCSAMKRLHDQGALTIAQDEDSCVVFGMPKEAIRAGAVSHILALEEIAQKIIAFGSDRNSCRDVAS
ncbi:MAG: two-component system chemotaxis response regulator CheB [Planctomycetota bacterium]|jgi:two-component system chemotaxis response regulator CheB